jgi:capsular exopolysaccharide synthesis family protein
MPLVFGTVAVVLAADIAFTLTRTPGYTSTATIYYAPTSNQLGQDKTTPVEQEQQRDQDVDTQVEVIKSPLVADAVITALQLDKDPDKDFKLDPKDQILPPAEKRDALIDKVVKKLRVRRVGQTLLISISFTNASPTRAAQIANTFAAKYIEHDVGEKLKDSKDANVLLNSQIDDMRQKVESAEAAVEAYKSANNLLGSGKDTTLSQTDIVNVDQSLALARGEEAQAKARFVAAQQQLKNGSTGDDVGVALGSQTISNLRQKRAELSAQVADLQTRYGPMHPDLRNAQAQLKDIDGQIQAEVNRLMSSLSEQVEEAHSKVQSIEATLATAQGKLAAGAAASVKLDELQRNADSAEKLYENVLDRVKETAAAQAVSQADSRIDTPATPTSEPSTPNKPLNLLLGLILGCGLGVGLAALRERWNAQVTNLDDVEGKLGLAFLGSVPTMQSSIDKPSTKQPIDAVVAHPLSAFAESFRGLATNLLHSNPGQTVQVVGITSALPAEGKTVTAISLARVQAMSGQSVVLLDCDLRRRSTDILFQGVAEVGLTEVLDGTVTFDQAVRIDEKTGAHYVPLTSKAHLAKSPFSGAAFDNLLLELRKRYSLIVLDTPPLLPVVDTRVLAQKVDALALLVRWRSTPMNAVKSAIHQLDSVHAPITGVALTQVNVKAQAYSGYGYPAYYHKDFKRYYQT